MKLNHRQIITVLALTLSISLCGKQSYATGVNALTGDWSTNGTELILDSSGGTIEFTCANGVLSAPVVLDATNSFQVTGFFSTDLDEVIIYPDGSTQSLRNQVATYSGSVDPTTDILTLQIVLQDGTQTFSPITLDPQALGSPIIHCMGQISESGAY
jgi:hypothetical protein